MGAGAGAWGTSGLASLPLGFPGESRPWSPVPFPWQRPSGSRARAAGPRAVRDGAARALASSRAGCGAARGSLGHGQRCSPDGRGEVALLPRKPKLLCGCPASGRAGSYTFRVRARRRRSRPAPPHATCVRSWPLHSGCFSTASCRDEGLRAQELLECVWGCHWPRSRCSRCSEGKCSKHFSQTEPFFYIPLPGSLLLFFMTPQVLKGALPSCQRFDVFVP